MTSQECFLGGRVFRRTPGSWKLRQPQPPLFLAVLLEPLQSWNRSLSVLSVRNNQPPANWRKRGFMLVMVLWRKRVMRGNRDFMSASLTTIDSGIWCFCFWFVEIIERLIVGLLQKLLVFINSHLPSPLFTLSRKLLR